RQRPAQVLTLDEFHDQGALFHAVDGRDVRMIELCQDLRFALEARHALGILSEGRREHLDRHVAIQARVPRAIDLAHAARAERREDLVGSDSEARTKRHDVPDYTGKTKDIAEPARGV